MYWQCSLVCTLLVFNQSFSSASQAVSHVGAWHRHPKVEASHSLTNLQAVWCSAVKQCSQLFPLISITTRRCGLLPKPASSSGRGLWPLDKVFCCPLWILYMSSFSSDHWHFSRNFCRVIVSHLHKNKQTLPAGSRCNSTNRQNLHLHGRNFWTSDAILMPFEI